MIAALLLASAVALRHALRTARAAPARRRLAGSSGTPDLLPHVARVVAPLLAARSTRTLERSLPDALDAVARSLRSGASLPMAIDEAARSATGMLGRDLTDVTTAVGAGAAVSVALDRWARLRPVSGVRLTAAALSLGADTGGASAQAVDGVAATLRTNLAIAGEVRALSSQARLSALVIAVAPIAFSVLAATADRRTLTFLLGTPTGLACVAIGVGLDALGWLWMRRLTAAVA